MGIFPLNSVIGVWLILQGSLNFWTWYDYIKLPLVLMFFVLYDDKGYYLEIISPSADFVASSPTKQGRHCHIIYHVLLILWRIIFIMWWYELTSKVELVNIDPVVVNVQWHYLFTSIFPVYLFCSSPQNPLKLSIARK